MSIENVIYRKQKKVDESLNIWAELADVGDKYGAVSLGKGVTHFQPPDFLVNNLLDAIKEGNNHYTNTFIYKFKIKLKQKFELWISMNHINL